MDSRLKSVLVWTGKAAAGGFASAVVGYFVKAVLAGWGVLDAPAGLVAEVLRRTVTGEDLGNVAALATGLAAWGALIWFWRPKPARLVLTSPLQKIDPSSLLGRVLSQGEEAPTSPVLKGGFTLRPDTPLADAIKFAATANWSGDLGELSSGGYLIALDKAVSDFTDLAANNSIRVFYRGFRDAPHQTLEHTSWFSHRIDIMDVLNGEAVLRRRKDGTRIETCHDLRVCRAQWDANWDYLRSTLA